jgi:hypothetical protein
MLPLIQPVVNLIGLSFLMLMVPIIAVTFAAMGTRLLWWFALGGSP